AQAEKLADGDSDVFLDTGDALLILGDYNGAMQRFTRSLEDPDADHVQTRIAIARVMQERNEWDDAKQQLGMALAEGRVNPDQEVTAEHLLQTADLELKMHEFDTAERIFIAAQKAGAAPQVVALGLANSYLAQGKHREAEAVLQTVGNLNDYDQSYDYVVAMAEAYRQEGQQALALQAYSRANEMGVEDGGSIERQLLDVSGNQGLNVTKSLGVSTSLDVNPVFDLETVYMLDARFRGLPQNSNLLPPPRVSTETRWTNGYRYDPGGSWPIITGFFQERNARGEILVPSDNLVQHRNTWDSTFNSALNPVLQLGSTKLSFNTGLQFTLRRDKQSPIEINQDLFRQFVYLNTSPIFNWMTIHGYALHESGPFSSQHLSSSEKSALVEFSVGQPWGKTALITGYSVRDLQFNPRIVEWFYTGTYAGLERRFGENFKLRAVGEYLRAWYVQNTSYVTAQALHPRVDAQYDFKKHWSLQANAAFFRGESYHAYDNANAGFLVTYTKPLRFGAESRAGRFETEYPLRISFGMQQQAFPDFPGSKKGTVSPVISISLF
ncbi:MAG: tetratricopeptide repeat protein, partial [Acidobacteriales bacterium]|nr:tetratricopeptide repeat protein [Terriglobales bacterium]